MRISIGVENGNDNRSIAWALEYPGCFAYGTNGSDAILHFPEALLRYKEWINSHGPVSWLTDLGDFDIHLTETYDVPIVDGEMIESWFEHDRKPLTAVEIKRGLLILQWSRMDLLELTSSLSPEQLNQSFPDERWSITGILKHVANAEWWYLDRLSLAGMTREELPSDPYERLQTVRARANEVIPTFSGLEDVRLVDGETWSPRKILRRSAWHEIDHIEHIFKLIPRL